MTGTARGAKPVTVKQKALAGSVRAATAVAKSRGLTCRAKTEYGATDTTCIRFGTEVIRLSEFEKEGFGSVSATWEPGDLALVLAVIDAATGPGGPALSAAVASIARTTTIRFLAVDGWTARCYPIAHTLRCDLYSSYWYP